jgi:hypothetical protein
MWVDAEISSSVEHRTLWEKKGLYTNRVLNRCGDMGQLNWLVRRVLRIGVGGCSTVGGDHRPWAVLVSCRWPFSGGARLVYLVIYAWLVWRPLIGRGFWMRAWYCVVRVPPFVASARVDNPSYRRPVCDRVLCPEITTLIHCHCTMSSFLV